MDLHCHQCGSRVEDLPVGKGQILRCGLCHDTLKKYRPQGAFEAACALAVFALVLLGLANAYPIMNFSVAGNLQSNEIVTGVWVLFRQGYWPISLLVLWCAILAPALYFSGVAYASASCFCRVPLPHAERFARVAERAQPWSLLPVFAAACFVSAVKLKLIGTVDWQPGVWLILLLALTALLLSGLFDGQEALRIIAEKRSASPAGGEK